MRGDRFGYTTQSEKASEKILYTEKQWLLKHDVMTRKDVLNPKMCDKTNKDYSGGGEGGGRRG